MDLEQACDRYLDFLRVERNLSPRTVEAYGHDLTALRAYLTPRGVSRVDALSANLLQSWLQSLAARGLKSTTQARARSAVRQLCAFLCRESQLTDNPAGDLEAPRRARPLPTVVACQQVNRILDSARDVSPRGLRNRAALELLYGSGLRASEVCGLRLENLHLDAGLVRPLGKGARERMVPLGETSRQALATYLLKGRPLLLKGCPCPYVFVGNRSRALSRMALYNIVRKQALVAGITMHLSPHALRHAFATHLLQGGADLRSVQLLLGHASISTTEIYTHVASKELHETVDAHHPLGAGLIPDET